MIEVVFHVVCFVVVLSSQKEKEEKNVTDDNVIRKELHHQVLYTMVTWC